MITIKVEEYCHGCPEFEPSVGITNMYAEDFFGGQRVVMTETVITCVHDKRCESINSYFVIKDTSVIEFKEMQSVVKMQYELYRRMMNRSFVINNTIFTGKDGQ